MPDGPGTEQTEGERESEGRKGSPDTGAGSDPAFLTQVATTLGVRWGRKMGAAGPGCANWACVTQTGNRNSEAEASGSPAPSAKKPLLDHQCPGPALRGPGAQV